MRRILSIIIAVVFIFSFMVPFVWADEQSNEKLPYQKFIDEGWLYKEEWNTNGEWTIVKDKIMDIAYSPELKQGVKLIAIKKEGDWGTFIDYNEVIKNNLFYSEGINDPDTQEFWDQEADVSGIVANTLITINGINWQESKYKDMILAGTFKEYPELNDPAYIKYMADPKYNGKAIDYIYFYDGVDLYLNSAKMDVRYELQEEHKTLPIAVFSDGGNSMIPLRGVLEELGATVNYDNTTKEIVIEDKGHKVLLKLGSNVAKVDGKEKIMPKPVYTKNGNTVIPLRFVSENLEHWIGFYPEEGNKIYIIRAKNWPPA